MQRIVALLGATALLASTAWADSRDEDIRKYDYPRIANIYLLGSVDESEIPLLARYDLLVLNPVWTNEQLAQLHALNPDIQLIMIVNAYAVKVDPYPLNQFKVDLYEYASENDLWWYNANGEPASDWQQTLMVNPTKEAPEGSEGPWIRWLARRVAQQLRMHPEWDGIFLDNFWERISWAQPRLQLDTDCNPTHRPECCDGTADSRTDLDAAWNKAMWEMAKRLNHELRRIRHHTGKRYVVFGNSSSDYFRYLNGTMLENFPFAARRDPWNVYSYGWKQSMLDPSGGYLEEMFVTEPYRANILNAGWTGSKFEPFRSPAFQRHKRLTMASALLGDGFYCLNTIPGHHATLWWEPEYDLNGTLSGYLGAPLGPAFRTAQPYGESIVPDGDFSTGVALPWRLRTVGAQATVKADYKHYLSAPASALVNVGSTSGPRTVKFYTSPIPVVEGQPYTLRFWARASKPQEITVHLYSPDCPQNVCLGNTGFRVLQDWKEFEYSFISTGTAGAGLNIFMDHTGKYWFDDIRIQHGDTNVFRRNFENGIVILNYANDARTVSLGKSYRKLDVPGLAAYDGAVVFEETLGPSDARILLSIPDVPSKASASKPAVGVTALRGASPNPFNPVTGIHFDLARESHVRLELYDAAGRRVRALVDEIREAGAHTVRWEGRDRDGRRLPSGVYICALETESKRETIKVLLIE